MTLPRAFPSPIHTMCLRFRLCSGTLRSVGAHGNDMRRAGEKRYENIMDGADEAWVVAGTLADGNRQGVDARSFPVGDSRRGVGGGVSGWRARHSVVRNWRAGRGAIRKRWIVRELNRGRGDSPLSVPAAGGRSDCGRAVAEIRGRGRTGRSVLSEGDGAGTGWKSRLFARRRRSRRDGTESRALGAGEDRRGIYRRRGRRAAGFSRIGKASGRKRIAGGVGAVGSEGGGRGGRGAIGSRRLRSKAGL